MTFILPQDPKERKKWPVGTFLREYFPDAFCYLANLSWKANEQHNPGEPMHWARGKSTDQEDTMLRHFMEGGTVDTDGLLHSAKVAWRALATLQLELEERFKDDGEDTEPLCDDCLSYRFECECGELCQEPYPYPVRYCVNLRACPGHLDGDLTLCRQV